MTGQWIRKRFDISKIKLSRLALFAILLLSGFLNLYQINKEGFGNTYYAAGVKSMLTSWQNFFFVSFDPSGFVSLDKPPLGFWIQTISAKILGFSGWSVIFPQAIAGIISVFIVYRIVLITSGLNAGTLAALFMAVTPIAVATNRNNTIDSLLLLTSLLAVWAVYKALETGNLIWLLICLGFIGLGFNIKMAQALLILPGCLLLYWVIAPFSNQKKIHYLFLGGIVLIFVSCIWMTFVELTPPNQRPFVGGSQNNSPFELAITYNGISRWIGLPQTSTNTSQNTEANQPNDGILPDETGNPGVFRLFNRQLGGQVSWLLPIAIFILGFSLLSTWKSKTPLARFHFEILWGGWLIACLAFFSFGAFFHRHYLIMLAPPVSALSAIGLTHQPMDPKWRGFYLPFILFIGLVTSIIILVPFSPWNGWFLTAVIGVEIVSITGLIATNNLLTSKHFRLESIFLGLGIFSLLIPQFLWAGIPVLNGGNGGLPFAGPDVLTWNRYPIDVDIQYLIDDLNGKYRSEKYYVGTFDYDPAEWIILKTGKPVMVMGGFYGTDPILTPSELAMHVSAKEIRSFFFYESTVRQLRPDLLAWFHQNCSTSYPTPLNGENYFQLYDCGGKQPLSK